MFPLVRTTIRILRSANQTPVHNGRTDIMNTLRNPKIAGILWLIARLWLGYEWLAAGIEKVFGEGSAAWVGAKAGSGVTGFLKGAIAKSPLAPGFDPATGHPAVQGWYATLVRDI